MKKKIVDALQQFSKGMFVPVLILPIAGLLIALGNVLTNAKLAAVMPFLKNPIIFGFGKMLSGSLVSILTNLGLIFCVGLAIGLAKDKKSHAAFAAVLSYLVFINAMLEELRMYDLDAERQNKVTVVVKEVIKEMDPELRLTLTTDPKEAFTNADFIFAQMRVGKYAMRELDEKVPLKYDVVGKKLADQEVWLTV